MNKCKLKDWLDWQWRILLAGAGIALVYVWWKHGDAIINSIK